MRLPSLPIRRNTPIIFFITLLVVTTALVSVIIYSDLGTSETILNSGTIINLLYFGSICYALIRPHYIVKHLKQGLEQAVIEFETLKKVIFILLFTLISLAVLSYVYPFYLTYYLGIYLYESNLPYNETLYWANVIVAFNELLLSILFPLSLLWIPPILMYALIILKKESRFYFAKTCFTIALNKRDVFKQMRYLNKGLQEYNK